MNLGHVRSLVNAPWASEANNDHTGSNYPPPLPRQVYSSSQIRDTHFPVVRNILKHVPKYMPYTLFETLGPIRIGTVTAAREEVPNLKV